MRSDQDLPIATVAPPDALGRTVCLTPTRRGKSSKSRQGADNALARHEEAAEKAEHPLNRIANIERTDAGVVIATTDIHLPRRIGEAIERAYRGTLEMHFDDAAYFMRADWRRPS